MLHRLALLMLITVSVAASAQLPQAPSAGFCIENQSPQSALFAVTPRNGPRKLARLAPGERLCAPLPSLASGGFVSVFYDETAVEGCSRLAPAGTVQVLLKYAAFDNCAWQLSP